ncbi:EboA domain-containing protein [Streptomyces sp. 4N509B]|uniref:EboA domain-containing protein n=1 Tax=Streptomyces sp. 4N509B TaxID=3457413 RepID=UPI003FD093CC
MSAPRLDDEARDRLAALTDEVRADPSRVAVLFPAVARRVARGPADPADPDGLLTPRLEDSARVALLRACAPDAEEVAALYRHGDADEKRAVLRALADLTLDPADAALPLVTDALRSNDPRLIAAALGPYAARHLDAPAWRQGVLKCLFTEVPLDAVARLADRADAELVRMAAAYRDERLAAGRPVPPDVERVLALPLPPRPHD